MSKVVYDRFRRTGFASQDFLRVRGHERNLPSMAQRHKSSQKSNNSGFTPYESNIERSIQTRERQEKGGE